MSAARLTRFIALAPLLAPLLVLLGLSAAAPVRAASLGFAEDEGGEEGFDSDDEGFDDEGFGDDGGEDEGFGGEDDGGGGEAVDDGGGDEAVDDGGDEAMDDDGGGEAMDDDEAVDDGGDEVMDDDGLEAADGDEAMDDGDEAMDDGDGDGDGDGDLDGDEDGGEAAEVDWVDDDAYYDPFADSDAAGEGEGGAPWWEEDEASGVDAGGDEDEDAYFDPYAFDEGEEAEALGELLEGELSEDDVADLSPRERERLAELRELEADVGDDLPADERIPANAAIKLFRTALTEACPQTAPAQLEACLRGPAVAERVGAMSKSSVAQWLLGLMDVDLPVGLGTRRIDGIVERCSAQGDAWSAWVSERLPEHVDGCTSDPAQPWVDCVVDGAMSDYDAQGRQEAFAQCVVEDPAVATVYVAVQRKKKKAFHPKLYLHYRGLMSSLTVDELRSMREACGSDTADLAALRKCFSRHPEVAERLNAVAALAEGATAGLAGGDDPEAAKRFKARFSQLFLTMPALSIELLAEGCGGGSKAPGSLSEAETILSCMERSASQNPLANPAFISPERLAEWYPIIRETLIDRLREQEVAAQERAFNYIFMFLGGLGLLGSLAIALMPLALRKRRPEVAPAQLWKSSGIAAVTFLITIALLSGSLLVTRSVQGGFMIDNTSPKLVVVKGLFNVLERPESRQRFADMSKAHLDFVRTPLQKVLDDVRAVEADVERVGEVAATEVAAVREGDLARYEPFAAYISEHWIKQLREPEIELYLASLQRAQDQVETAKITFNARLIQDQVETFQALFELYRKVDWLMGYVPMLMAIVAAVVYLVPLRDTLSAIAMAPIRAAESDSKDMVQQAKALIFAELKLLLPYLLVAFLVILVTGFFLALAIEPFIELLLNYTLLTVFYILLSKASVGVLYATLGGALVLLVLCLGIYIAASVLFLGATRKVLRARFHDGDRLLDKREVWLWSLGAVLWVLVFPWIYSMLIGVSVGALTTTEVTAPPSNVDMLLVPLVAVVLMPTLLWALRVFAALNYIRKAPELAKAKDEAPEDAEQPG